MNDQTNNQDGLKKLTALIDDIKTGMFVTADEDGTLRSRPMRHQTVENDIIWFFTGMPSGKTEEIRQDAHVNVAYGQPSDNKFVSVSGTARVVKDRQKIDQLWDPSLKAWFPEGKDDPNMALIQVKITKGEYWDTPNNVMIHLYGIAKATLTGETYNPGDNQKVNVS